MSRIAIHLFGFPRIERDGRALELDRRKAIALVAYLAVTGRSQERAHGREELLALLWPELDTKRARAALRRTLFALRKAAGDGLLVVSQDAVALANDRIWCDVQEFEKGAIELYHGDFLQGFSVRDARTFEDWQLLESERLRAEVVNALEQLISSHAASDDVPQALAYARRLLHHEPLHEGGHRWVMELHQRQGRPQLAVEQFARYRRMLQEQLEVDPPAPLVKLRNDIQRRTVISPMPDVEPEELRESWYRAVDRNSWNELAERLDAVSQAFDIHGRFEEGVRMMADGLAIVPERESLAGRIQVRSGTLQASRGRFHAAREALVRGLAILHRFGELRESAFGFNRLGYVAFALGRRAEAFRCLERSASMFRELSDLSGLAWSLNVLGHLHTETGTVAKARPLLDESFETGCELGQRQRVGSSLNSLGKTAFRERKIEAAGELFEKALRLRQGLGHRIGIADSLNNLGDVMEASGESAGALDHYRQALTTAVEIEALPLVMEIFIGVGDLLYRRDERPLSAELLSLARHHAGTWWEAKRRAASILSKVESQSSRRDFERAVTAGRAMPYTEAASRVLRFS